MTSSAMVSGSPTVHRKLEAERLHLQPLLAGAGAGNPAAPSGASGQRRFRFRLLVPRSGKITCEAQHHVHHQPTSPP